MTGDNGSDRRPSLLGRLLYGGTLLYMGIDGFRHNQKRVEVARERGVPYPDVLVPLATGLLVLASLLLIFWIWPVVAAAAILLFFLSTTPAIHSFWTFEGKERAGQKTNFLKNMALIGGALVLLDLARGGEEE